MMDVGHRPRHPGRAGRGRPSMAQRDGGSVALEVALVAPALLAFLMLVIVTGRIADARGDVQSAASAAARAASLRGTLGSAHEVADSTARANLDASSCGDIDVQTTGDLQPGGSVTVSVSCTADHSDLALIALPGAQRFTGEATSVVDQYRGSGR